MRTKVVRLPDLLFLLRGRGERRGDVAGRRGPADDAALGDDHVERRLLEGREVGLRRVLDEEAVEAAVVGLAERRLDADLRRDARDDEVRTRTPARRAAASTRLRGSMGARVAEMS